MMLLLGMGLSIPASLLAGFAPSDGVLFVARLLGGVAAGMAYPTTLALITALWSGAARTRSIALWSAIGGAIASLGPLLSGALLEQFDWGSVFLVTLPLAVARPVHRLALCPRPRQRGDRAGRQPRRRPLDPADRGAGAGRSTWRRCRARGRWRSGSASIAIAAAAAFVIRQRRARSPLYDLEVAARRIFWVAACAGIIVFGSLMGAMFIGQQFLQNVLGYSTLDSGLAILPAAVLMVIVAPRSAKLVETRGARFTLLIGYVFCVLGFLTMLLLWKEGIAYWKVGLGYALIGVGVGFAGTPASHSLTGSVPVKPGGDGLGHRRPAARPRRRDHAVDLRRPADRRLRRRGQRRDRLLRRAAKVTENIEGELTKSFSSAADLAAQYPQLQPADHRRGQVLLPAGRRTGPTPPASSRSCSAPRWSSSSSRSTTRRRRCSTRYNAEDA